MMNFIGKGDFLLVTLGALAVAWSEGPEMACLYAVCATAVTRLFML